MEMGERLAELEADADRGIPGAQERLELFREKRKLLVDSIIQAGSISSFRFRCRLLTPDTELRQI